MTKGRAQAPLSIGKPIRSAGIQRMTREDALADLITGKDDLKIQYVCY